MSKFYVILKYTLIVLFVTGLFISSLYIVNARYFGPLEIKVQGYSTDAFLLNSRTPFYRQLSFLRNDSSYNYPFNRFYKTLEIELLKSYPDSVTVVIASQGGSVKSIRQKVNKNHAFEIDLKAIKAYSFSEKIINIFSFAHVHYLKAIWLIACVMLILIITIVLGRTKRKWRFFIRAVIMHKYLSYTVFIAVTLIIFVFIVKNQLHNSVGAANSPDQIDYHSCAVNFSKGYGFLYGGKVDDSIDYKIDLKEASAKMQHEYFAGLKRLDRFPGFIFVTGLLYKIFGVNPIIIYIFQLLILCFFVCTIPFTVGKVWGEKGFWGGLIVVPMLLFYLYKYAFIISPDLITVVINFYVLFFYIMARKDWSLKYFIFLSFLTGLSFLFKASLMLFALFMWGDILITTFRKHKNMFVKLIGCFVLFMLCWVPYNLWSISQSLKYEKNANTLFSRINNSISFADLTRFVKENKDDFGIYDTNFDFKQEDLFVYNTLIKPELESKNYPDFNILPCLNNSQRFLFFAKYQFKFSSYFFMTKLYHNGTSLLEVHNEFVNDGNIHPEWMADKMSYYNNDGLTDKPAIIRTAMFYFNNPRFIFLLPHYKLKSYFSHNLIVLFLILIIGLLRLLCTIKMFSNKNVSKENTQNVIWIGVTTLLLICASFLNQFVYIYLTISFLIILPNFYSSLINLPVKFMLLSSLIFPVITYGTPRYLIYYDSVLFIIFGVLLIELFLALFNLKTTIKDTF